MQPSAMLTIPSFRRALFDARKEYSRAASLIEQRISTQSLTSCFSERIVGVGVACDWVRRAAEMEGVTYIGKQLSESNRSASFIELLRFNFAWFGLNAIFTRGELITLIGRPASDSEYRKFRVLYDATPLANEATTLAKLQAILAAPTSPRLPGRPSGTVVSTITAIQHKYLKNGTRLPPTARAIANAAATGRTTTLDLPTIIYAFRNWSVHGNALDGSFGSRPRFLTFVMSILEVLGEVHLNTSRLIRAAV